MENNKYQDFIDYLVADEARAAALLALSAEDACAKMNADGLNITPEELQNFDEVMAKIEKAGSADELSENDLDDVAGGATITVAMVIGAMAKLGGAVKAIEWFLKKGYQLGRWVAKKFGYR